MPLRTASSPQRPPPVRPNNAHSPPKGTPGRSKARRHDGGSSFTSTLSANNNNPPAVHRHAGVVFIYDTTIVPHHVCSVVPHHYVCSIVLEHANSRGKNNNVKRVYRNHIISSTKCYF